MSIDKIADVTSAPSEYLAPVKPKESPKVDKSIEVEATRGESKKVQDDETAGEGLNKVLAKRTAEGIIDRARERMDDMREIRDEAIEEQEVEEAEQETEAAEAEAEEEINEEASAEGIAKRKTEQLLSEALAHKRHILNQPED